MLPSVVWWKFTDVSEELAATIIALMMVAASASETSLNFYQITRRKNPEDSHLHTRRRENLKSHKAYICMTECISSKDSALHTI
jgi:hypothetical protein